MASFVIKIAQCVQMLDGFLLALLERIALLLRAKIDCFDLADELESV